jgi:hypothetical protein
MWESSGFGRFLGFGLEDSTMMLVDCTLDTGMDVGIEEETAGEEV